MLPCNSVKLVDFGSGEKYIKKPLLIRQGCDWGESVKLDCRRIRLTSRQPFSRPGQVCRSKPF
jgi:hypothetical protein